MVSPGGASSPSPTGSERNLQSLSDFAMDVVVEVVRDDDLLVLDRLEDVLALGGPVQLEHRALDLRDDAPVESRMHGKGLGRNLLRPGEHHQLLALLRRAGIDASGYPAAGHRLALENRLVDRVVRARVDGLDLVRRHAGLGDEGLYEERAADRVGRRVGDLLAEQLLRRLRTVLLERDQEAGDARGVTRDRHVAEPLAHLDVRQRVAPPDVKAALEDALLELLD